MDGSLLPEWAWLVVGLLAALVIGNTLTLVLFGPLGLPAAYQIVPVIALMAPVLLFVPVWQDDERAAYWEASRAHVIGDLAFVVVGAAIGTATALVALQDLLSATVVRELIGMAAGVGLAWGLFWWRNVDLYRDDRPAA